MSPEYTEKTENLRIWLGMVKFLIGTVALSILTLMINSKIEANKITLEENKFDNQLKLEAKKFMSDYIAQFLQFGVAKDLDKRRDFVRYLVTLETDLLEPNVSHAEAELAAARAQLALLQARPRPEAVAVAEAELKAAEGALAHAMAQRDQPDVGATDAETAAAQAQVAAAMAERLAAEKYHNLTMKCVEFDLPGNGTESINGADKVAPGKNNDQGKDDEESKTKDHHGALVDCG